MMKKLGATYLELIIHAFCWTAITFLFIQYNAFSFHYLRGDLMVIPLLFGTIINILLFYVNLFLLFPKYTQKRFNTVHYIIWIFALCIVFSVVENFFDYYYAAKHFSNEKVVLQPEELIATSIINLIFIIFSALYAFSRSWIKNEVIKRKLTEENLKLELNYLRSQINPHFLFNTLNNLYSVAIKNEDKETAGGLSKLSTLMRFMLDKSDKTTVKLAEEIEYLKSYIELEKLRFLEEDDLMVSFKTEGEIRNFNIPPFLLINFVENAFKHGVNYKLHSEININLNVNEKEMLFRVENSNHALEKTNGSSKIGLENVKKRLELIYGSNYELTTESKLPKYIVKLKIKNLQN